MRVSNVNTNKNYQNNKPSFQQMLISSKTGSQSNCSFALRDWKQELKYLDKFIKEFKVKKFTKTDNGLNDCKLKFISKNGDTIEYNERIPHVKGKYKIKPLQEVRITYVDKNKNLNDSVFITTTNMSRDVRTKFAEYLEKMEIKSNF